MAKFAAKIRRLARAVAVFFDELVFPHGASPADIKLGPWLYAL